jgi:hypothetical protein
MTRLDDVTLLSFHRRHHQLCNVATAAGRGLAQAAAAALRACI